MRKRLPEPGDIVKDGVGPPRVVRRVQLQRILALDLPLPVRESLLVPLGGRVVRGDGADLGPPAALDMPGKSWRADLQLARLRIERIPFRVLSELLEGDVPVVVAGLPLDLIDALLQELLQGDPALLRLTLHTPLGNVLSRDGQQRLPITLGVGPVVFHDPGACQYVEELLLRRDGIDFLRVDAKAL